ncbi:MAG: leucine-rich repeat protein, partial [Eubacteriales bacterium]|nr:leucine-rich repeat protein [Eubacteriales bacterium]
MIRMKRKKVISIFIAFMLLLLFVSVKTVFAGASIEGTYNLGPTGSETAVTGTLYSDGSFVVEGNGVMGDFLYYGHPMQKVRSQIISVVITSGVLNIGNYMFYQCENLESVTISNTVRNINDYAFQSCSKLSSVTFDSHSTLLNIGTHSFSRCSALQGITIPDSVNSFAGNSFYYSGLNSITIPSMVKNLGSATFSYCNSLATVSFTSGSEITSIGQWVFGNCTYLTSINIPESVTVIDSNAFNNCSALPSITIPAGVTNINYAAFQNCTSLATIINNHNGNQTIANMAFDKCGTNVTTTKRAYAHSANTKFITVTRKLGYIINYTVTFESNGGSVVQSKTEIPYNTIIAAPTTPTKTGFTLEGWYKESDLSNKWDFTVDKVTSDITLYAKWEISTVVSVDVTWGSMEFTYSDGTWNPETHEYEGTGWTVDENANKISVTSTSNVPVTVSYTFEQETGYEEVNGSFTNGTNPIVSESLSKGDITPQSCNAYIILSGKPPE